jgi:hypothetical protein
MKLMTILTCFSLILALWQSAAAAQARVGAAAPDFALKDQYDKETKLSQLRGGAVLLVYGDSDGSNFFQNWFAAVRQKFPPDRVKLIPIINFDGGVPFFMKGNVAGRFQGKTADGQPKTAKLMDWDGLIAKQYGATKKVTNVYLVDSQGALQFSGAGKGVGQETDGLMLALERILNH